MHILASLEVVAYAHSFEKEHREDEERREWCIKSC